MRRVPGRIAAINDLAGYGRCSLAVMLPVISACGCQCCPVPTAVLSSSNECGGPFLHELTGEMPAYIRHWEGLGLTFDGIYSGYFSSSEQIESALYFIERFKREDTVLLVDPVLGDQGRLSPRCDGTLMRRYLHLIRQADLITPNFTEACYLAGETYTDFPTDEAVDRVGRRLLAAGPGRVIITGVRRGGESLTYLYGEAGRQIISVPYCPQERAGAGDMFASILLSKYLGGESLEAAAGAAASFVSRTLAYSLEAQVPPREGICFEPFLNELSPYGPAGRRTEME